MEYAIIILSLAVICLIAVNVIDYFWHKRIDQRVSELEYKNKHKIFTGSKPTNKLSGAEMNNARREKNMQHEDLLK